MKFRGFKLYVLVLATTTLLVLLMQWFVVAKTVPAVESNAQAAIDESLLVGSDVWQRRNQAEQERQTDLVSAVFSDAAFEKALNPEQPPPGGVFGAENRLSLSDQIDNFAIQRARADFAVVADDAGVPLLVQPALPGVAQADLQHAVVRLTSPLRNLKRRGKRAPSESDIVALGDRAYRVVVQDLGTRDQRRWLMVGFDIRAEVLQLRQDLRVHATLLAERGDRWLPVFSSLDSPALAAQLAGVDASAERMTADGETWRLRTKLLHDVPGERVVLRLSRSLASAEAEGQRMRRELWVAVALALAAFSVLLGLLSRFVVARSLSQLVEAARRVGAQDYRTAIAVGGPVREVRQLARALDGMRASLHLEEHFDRRLTQLPNRAHFCAELRQALEGAAPGPVAVLLVGLNRFKAINRNLGRVQGDALLREMARRLQAVCPTQFVARLGGDQFAVLLQGVDAASVHRVTRAVAQQISSELEKPVVLEGHRVDRSVAIGVAHALQDRPDDPELLLNRAEMALQAAKERREGHVVYEPSIDLESEDNLALLSDLRSACANNELRLHFQPKVRLSDGRLAGCEALLRWEHPQRGSVPPGQFLPRAEDDPLMKELTRWVFEAVVKEKAALHAQGIDSISINLSALDLMDDDLPGKLEEVLHRYGARAEGLCLETTEGAVMSDFQRALATLRALRERGFKLSMDDFGEGQTSLRYLKDLPVQELKLDMVFIKGMQSDARTESIVKAMIDVGHQYGMRVVAEGVENAAVAQRLRELGCDEGQGWHFGKPMPAPALRAFAASRASAAEAMPALG
jgi:diguanylate cyclase (GGDEF)-like protein